MSNMRIWMSLVILVLCAFSAAQRIVLIPLDSRPAAGQFAQMIAKMANVSATMPPYETLGRFTAPGNPDRILDWLEGIDKSEVTAIIASADMISFGGLIQSRENKVPLNLAKARFNRFLKIARTFPKTQVYVFSATMRLTPTATKEAAGYRLQLARFAELSERFSRTNEKHLLPQIERAKSQVDPIWINSYYNARKRNHQFQRFMIYSIGKRQFDYLVIGQDDAKPYGPHVPEGNRLRLLANNIGLTGRVYFCEGIDQHSNVLVSRSLLKANNWTPKVRVVYSDESGKFKFASFESKKIEDSLLDQIIASGAKIVTDTEDFDYTLYLNTPKPDEAKFNEFIRQLESDIEQNLPVAVADINLANDGTADPRLFEVLWTKGRMTKVLGYAGWNTAGNTMGTAIPAANVYLLARRIQVDPLTREVAQRTFLLHRLVNDFAYHKFTRPEAYKIIDAFQGSREETYGTPFREVNAFVVRDLTKYIDRYFRDQFLGKRFFAGARQYVFSNLNDIKVFLPWPRAYEVRLEFLLQTEPVEAFGQSNLVPLGEEKKKPGLKNR